jgi:hypothetical protein
MVLNTNQVLALMELPFGKINQITPCPHSFMESILKMMMVIMMIKILGHECVRGSAGGREGERKGY